MKRNEYKTPKTSVVCLWSSNVLCLSDVTSDKGIGYGGVDDSGSIIPSTREKDTYWDSDSDWE